MTPALSITPHLLKSDTGFHYVISVKNSQDDSKQVLKGFANEHFKTEYAAIYYATKRTEEFALNFNHMGVIHTNASKAVEESQKQANKTNQKTVVLERNLGGYKTYRVAPRDSFSLDDAFELYALSKPNTRPIL